MADGFFRRLFRRSRHDTSSSDLRPTAELEAPPLFSPTAARTPIGESLRAEIGMLSDAGCVREINEDSIRVVRPLDADGSKPGVLLVVADGMGGHNAGEIASQLAVQTVVRHHADDLQDPAMSLGRSVERANRVIVERASEEPRYRGMGTTCTVLLLRDGLAYCAHVGDSRLYLMRSNDIFLMTEDHSAVMELVRQGAMTHEEARHHPERNVIVRALGARHDVDVASWEKPFIVRGGDAFLICTDGLHDLVDDEELRDAMRGATPQMACDRLVELARQRGGPDNITVAIVAVSEVPHRV
jgi:protein phosphatase